MSAYRQIVLASRPRGVPTSSDFRLEEGPIPVAERGQVLVRTLYLSLDPYMRGQMNAATPDPIEIGATMAGEVVAACGVSIPGKRRSRPRSAFSECRASRPTPG